MKLNLLSRLRKLVVGEEGSAVLEFVILALPLFIPLFIFLNQYSLQSDTESSLRTLSREMARAFVTSENDHVAERVTFEIFSKGAEILGFSDDLASEDLTYSFSCKEIPCISPNNEVVITIQSMKAARHISAVEYVSPWA
jgi:choline kinase